MSDQTVGNILKRHGIPPAPRAQDDHHMERVHPHAHGVLVATDFFTAEVWTLGGLVTYYAYSSSTWARQVQVAGVMPHPNEAWMVQVARNDHGGVGLPLARSIPDP